MLYVSNEKRFPTPYGGSGFKDWGNGVEERGEEDFASSSTSNLSNCKLNVLISVCQQETI